MNEDSPILKDLNDDQKRAAVATKGPVLIIAGAGTGKTKTLTHRVAFLISIGVRPENILAVTFTNKAAQEMAERIWALTNNKQPTTYKRHLTTYNTPFIGTFHSFCANILRNEAAKTGHTRHFTIIDEDDSLALIKEICSDLNISSKQYPPAMIKNIISGLKNELVSPDKYEGKDSEERFPKMIYQIYSLYEKKLSDSNSFDFDDLIMKTVEVFRNHSQTLEKYQDRFLYIHVDEYQDTNTAQYELTKLLAQKHKNLFVIGDDAQSIYSWRNADYRNILNFEKDWPDAKTIVLDKNYRSTKTVLDSANAVIKNNVFQKPKNLRTEKDKGDKIKYFILPSEKIEAECIVSEIQELLKIGLQLNDLAILYRTNAQSRAIEEVLLENEIPYKLIGGIRFYERKEIKDIIAYLRFVMNPKDALSLKRIINTPPRGIGKISFLKYLQDGPVFSNDQKPALIGFENLVSDLKKSAEALSPALLIREVVEKTNYEEYLTSAYPDADQRIENVKELISLAQKYPHTDPPDGVLKMLEDVSLLSDADEISGKKDALNLMTLHAAKGLEFHTVFISGLEEGVFPHAKSMFDPASLEEERRLCYVGLTRAKEKLVILRAYRRRLWGESSINAESRFIKEIPEGLIEKIDLVGEDDFDEEVGDGGEEENVMYE